MKQKNGFTLIELLVVISIIGVLSTIVLASLNTTRAKARDAIRKIDMQNIYNMLAMYQIEYGGIPRTSVYGDANAGGWDYSSQPTGTSSFMNFLVTSGITNQVPIDPINDMSGDMSPMGTYAYKYYCYSGQGLALGYRRETDGVQVYYPKYKDPDWTCL